MRGSSVLTRALVLAITATSALAANRSKWAQLAVTSPDGIIKLDSESYDELLEEPRDYGVALVLTALPAHFNCAPCR
jgi:oligosaccharyltransferase complex subunit gamma